jgi:hypothetical protein
VSGTPDSPLHPAHEPRRAIFRYGYVPAIVAGFVLALSVAADFMRPGQHWTQRAGSIVTVLGVFVAFVDARRSVKFIQLKGGYQRFENPELPYKNIAIALAIVGTVIWGYADIWL